MPDTAIRNAALLGQAALAYKMPIVMTSSQEDHIQGPLHPGCCNRRCPKPTRRV